MNINIIYASTSGNVEAVCEKVAEILKENKFEVKLNRAEQTDIKILLESEFLILATSTWEHGELNPFFKTLFDQMKEADFSGKKASFIGLGDKRYEPVLFAEGMEVVRKRFLDKGGEEIFEALRIDGEPYRFLDTDVTTWANNLAQKLK